MGQKILQVTAREVWSLAERQHGVVTRGQLLELGLSTNGIQHRVAAGRLHRVWGGVYAVGRPQLTHHGRWMAAVLCCGPEAALSHGSAAALWELLAERSPKIDVSVPDGVARRRGGIVLHRRHALDRRWLTRHCGISVTGPALTLVDIAGRLPREQAEAAVNEADRRDLLNPEQLRAALPTFGRRPGVAVLRELLDRRTFRLTDSQLERRFLPLVRRAGLPVPLTRRRVNGFRVDFWWPALGLVVETDGLRYHRTPAQQARDRLRDQAHTAAGLVALRFTHGQVRFDPDHVLATLTAVARRLAAPS